MSSTKSSTPFSPFYLMELRTFLHTSAFGMHPYVPFEIVISILSNLDWRTLVRCSAVCRFWQHVVRDTLSLQYKIDLGANGLVDGPASKLTIPERLHLLRERKHAWDTLGFRRCSVIPTPGECHAYELVGGVFAKAMNPYNDAGSAFAPNPGSRHFTFLSLPGKGREPDMVVWNDAGILCRDFGVDPTQDLIALVEQPDAHKPSITVHLRTIPLNEKHPAAAVPILSQPMRSSFDGAEIQICDDIIAILVRVHSIPRLVIWQWTSGKLLVSETFCSQSLRSMDDLSLLSNYAFMMTSRFPQGSIKVYTFRSPNGREPLCGPAKLSDLRCTTLCLPPLQPNNHYAELSNHTSPFTARIPAGVPFATSEDVRVHVMSVLTQPTQPPHSSSDSELGNTATGHAASFVVVMLNRALLKFADRGLASSESGYQKNVDVSWDEWGPRNTRWFSERSTHAWQRYVHGSRIVRTLHNAWPSTRCRMQVMDFCVHPLHPRTADDQAMEDIDAAEPDVPYTHRLVTKPSVMRDRTVFRGGGVESRLPYREVTLKKELGPYSGFMIDEERVIGLSAMAFANGDMKQVDVFTF